MAKGHMLADVVAIIGKRLIFVLRGAILLPHENISFFANTGTDLFLLLLFPTGTQDIVFGEVDR